MHGRGTIAVSGALGRKPGRGGHAWALLQWVLGLRRLAWDVVFVDRLDPDACVDAAGRLTAPDRSVGARYFEVVMRSFGLLGSAALLDASGGTVVGLARDEVLARMRGAAALVNVMGFLRDPAMLAAPERRVFLDIDPGYPQMWRQLGLADPFEGHDAFVTVGRWIGRGGCRIPDCGLDWHTCPPPVVLEQWPVRPRPPRDRVTSVATWRGAYGPVEFGGVTYGQRVHEFREFAEVPRAFDVPFELALDVSAADRADVDLLLRGEWSLVEPRRVAGDPKAYREYLAGSSVEFMVAKGMYVKTAGGWFSDRSACYLASGRPVVAQDTGLAPWYPTDKGVVAFSTPAEAAGALRAVFDDYPGHARAARRLAEEVFDSDVVLADLLTSLGIG